MGNDEWESKSALCYEIDKPFSIKEIELIDGYYTSITTNEGLSLGFNKEDSLRLKKFLIENFS